MTDYEDTGHLHVDNKQTPYFMRRLLVGHTICMLRDDVSMTYIWVINNHVVV